MVYLIFVDGGLWAVNTDKTSASQVAQQLAREGKGDMVRIVAVNGHVQEEIHKDDRNEE